MQLIRRLPIHLGLLTVFFAIMLAVSEPSSRSGSYATTVSAFEVNSRRVSPPVGQRRVRAVVEETFAGIPQRGAVLGAPKAPVTMQFFADPECPQARQFAIQLLPRLVRQWVRDGKLRIEYHGESAETIWRDIFEHQQMALLAAGKQGRLWQYLEFFYHYQGPEYVRYANDRFLRAMAREVRGLDFTQWTNDWGAPTLAWDVQHDLDIADAQGIRYTPAFLIGPTGEVAKPLLNFTLTEPLAFEDAFRGTLAELRDVSRPRLSS
jgi:hypothetical protein